MSESTTNSQGGGGMGIVIGVLVLAIIGALFFFGGGERPLERQATGLGGLVKFLKDNDIEARKYAGQGPLYTDRTDLRILPIYDTDLRSQRTIPETREDVIAQTSENDLNRGTFVRKTRTIPTVVVLPKWRVGMRLLNVAHEDLLIPDQEMTGLLEDMYLSGVQIHRRPDGFTNDTVTFKDQNYRIGLLHGQTFTSSDCAPLVGTRARMLVARCQSGDRAAFGVVADPDLLSNHGLAHAQNADLMLALIQERNLENAAILDMTLRSFATKSPVWGDDHERTWQDFARMFAWPFTMIWIAFFFVGALVLWRAVTRYGPVALPYSDEPEATKTVSIAAKARLLRLANHDVALLRSHIRTRLGDLAADLLGPHRGTAREPLNQILPMIARRDQALADELRAAADPNIAEGEVLRRLDRFENCHDRIRNEFGRAANAG